MKYITLADLSETIRKNIWKIPHNIDFIIGIPRSGTIVASIISKYLNVPLIDIENFLVNGKLTGGISLGTYKNTHIEKTHKVLVVEDTVFTGASIMSAKERLNNYNNTFKYIYMCAYFEGYASTDIVDIYLEDVRQYTNNFTQYVLYEWNIFQHGPTVTSRCLYDIDGVFCLDPPDERNEEEYLNYIKNAIPLFTPRETIGGIITYRLSKNKEITETWLRKSGIKYNNLIMFPANTWNERYMSGISPGRFKGDFYKNHDEYNLFVESEDWQAQEIYNLSNKPVYSVEKNKIYQKI